SRAARVVRMLIADVHRGIKPAPVKPDPATWSDNAITLAWIGHATVLINFYGVRILTDPSLGNRIGVSLGVGTAAPKRYFSPALRFEELPPIDVILLSHAHMDHMDLASLKRFAPGTFVVTAKRTEDILRGTGLKQITELPWGNRTVFHSDRGDLSIEAFEVK